MLVALSGNAEDQFMLHSSVLGKLSPTLRASLTNSKCIANKTVLIGNGTHQIKYLKLEFDKGQPFSLVIGKVSASSLKNTLTN